MILSPRLYRLSCALVFIAAFAQSPACAEKLFNLSDGMDGWTERSAEGSTDYTVSASGIRAEAEGVASVIERTVKLDMARAPTLTWRWRVDALQAGADIRDKTRDDMGAALILVFGEPSLFNRPPTLIYVWANEAVSKGDIVPSPRSGQVRYVVLRSGEAPLGQWVEETRDVAADFEAAFGEVPPAYARRLCLFTDGDQTGERGAAQYGEVSVIYSDARE